MATADESRLRRKKRIRKKVFGSSERPRLSVFRSAKHIYAQVVDDTQGVTLVAASTLAKDVKGETSEGNKTDAAKLVGAAIAKACAAKGIEKVVFDRNGFIYHGRIRALAEGAREAGLSF
ncbi:MAG: 50S ribosomal protein L18 [Sandaracinaceae bacterium]|nr:50S ribosomal protein L18 [Sandaracinaceae bacterium]MCC6876251.1 50S ribosomal protein L18 [Sandaracinaceae bacterium]